MPRPEFRNNKEIIDSMIRVDHAGEYAANLIYEAQIEANKNKENQKQLEHMLAQEQKHLSFFAQEMQKRGTRPSALLPIWKIVSYNLGFITSKFGIKTAMLCTEAVEDVIERHYSEQLEALDGNEKEQSLAKNIAVFRQEEIEHKDLAINYNDNSRLSAVIASLIGMMCNTAITLSKKL